VTDEKPRGYLIRHTTHPPPQPLPQKTGEDDGWWTIPDLGGEDW